MTENVLLDTIEAILNALHYIEDQTDELLNVLPDDVTAKGAAATDHLNRIYAASRDARTLTNCAYDLAAADVPERLADIETAKEHLAQLRAGEYFN